MMAHVATFCESWLVRTWDLFWVVAFDFFKGQSLGSGGGGGCYDMGAFRLANDDLDSRRENRPSTMNT
jgi:hypothetical protein